LADLSRREEAGYQALQELRDEVGSRIRRTQTNVHELRRSLKVSDTSLVAEAPSEEGQPYFEAKRDLEELQGFRQRLDARMLAARLESRLPKTSLVEILDTAKPELR